MKKILVFLLPALVLISCNDLLGPDLEITSVSPLAWYVYGPVSQITVDTIRVVPMNSQDAHITGIDYDIVDAADNVLYDAPEQIPIYLAVPGLSATIVSCTVSLYNIVIPAGTAIEYLFNNDLFSAKVNIRVISEADLFPERTDTAEAYVGIYRQTGALLLDSLDAEPDSIPRDSVSYTTVTVKLSDAGGAAIYGAAINWSVSPVGSFSEGTTYTNTSGIAQTLLYSDFGTADTTVDVTANSPDAGDSLTIQVKFYAP